MAEEKGAESKEFSTDSKLDKLMDMIGDACAKVDGYGARMDKMHERMDAAETRMDAMRKDESEKKEEPEEAAKDKKKDAAKKDSEVSEEAKEKEAETKETAADTDAKEGGDDDEREDKLNNARIIKRTMQRLGKRKDEAEADEDEEEKKDARMDSVARAEIASLKDQISRVTAQLPKALTDAEHEEFASIQAQADPAYQAYNDRAGPPLQGESTLSYRRRLASGLQKYSVKWEKSRLSTVPDADMLNTIATEIYADSIAAARRGTAVPAGQLRRIEKSSGTGHTIYEYEGEPQAWMDDFAGAHAKSHGDFKRA